MCQSKAYKIDELMNLIWSRSCTPVYDTGNMVLRIVFVSVLTALLS